MTPENAAAVAAHDQHRAAHLESMKKQFMRNPKRFSRMVAKTMQHIQDNAEFADHVGHGPEMLSCRLAIFGFHTLFEHIAMWEEEADAAAEDKPKRRRRTSGDGGSEEEANEHGGEG